MSFICVPRPKPQLDTVKHRDDSGTLVTGNANLTYALGILLQFELGDQNPFTNVVITDATIEKRLPEEDWTAVPNGSGSADLHYTNDDGNPSEIEISDISGGTSVVQYIPIDAFGVEHDIRIRLLDYRSKEWVLMPTEWVKLIGPTLKIVTDANKRAFFPDFGSTSISIIDNVDSRGLVYDGFAKISLMTIDSINNRSL
ncbi:MAG: hypothetical protein ACQETE_01550 [Bacteroidota bacterium]